MNGSFVDASQRHFVDQNGMYVGSWVNCEPDASLNYVEVAEQPESISQIYNFKTKKFSAFVEQVEQPSDIEIRLKALEMKTQITVADKAAAEQALIEEGN